MYCAAIPRETGIGVPRAENAKICKRTPCTENGVRDTRMGKDELAADAPVTELRRAAAVVRGGKSSQGSVDADLKINRGRRGRRKHVA